MKRQITISYQNRQSRGYGGSGIGPLSRDLPTSPKLVIANHFIEKISGFAIGEKVECHFYPGSILIRKITTV